MFTARYELIPYIKHIMFRLWKFKKEVNQERAEIYLGRRVTVAQSGNTN
jgi:hypothetical protein